MACAQDTEVAVSSDLVRIAVVGLGAMGANHVRVIQAHPSAVLSGVCDTDPERAAAIGESLGIPSCSSIDDLQPSDAVVLATPTAFHAEDALSLLATGIPLFVEKPLADDLVLVQALIDTATAGGVPLMCGFVERFNPAVACARELIDEPPIHVLAVRHSPHNPRATASVVYDLLIHDIDLVLNLLDQEVASVVSQKWTSDNGLAEVADCSLGFASGAVATLSASRTGHRKVRSVSITTPTALIEVDLLRHDVTLYRHRSHQQIGESLTYRAATTIDIPFVRHSGEPLTMQLGHFVDLIRGDADPALEMSRLFEPHRIAAEIEGVSA